MKSEEMVAVANYRQQLRKKPDLKYMFFELTDCCNLACLHCGSRCTSHNHTYLEYEIIVKVLDELADRYGTERIVIVLTGGEPLLHRDFFKIVEYINEKGFRWGMTSNATLINKEIAERLVDHQLGSISVSLDGLKVQHESLRVVKGSFESAIEGIKNLLQAKKYPMPVQITTVISKLNIDSLEQIYQLALDAGVDSFRPINMEPIGRALDHRELLLEDEDYIRLLDFIKEKRSEASGMEVTFGCSHYLGESYEKEARKYYWICGSGIYVGSVLCNGDIFSCLDIERRPELIQGNVHTDSFVDVWENRFEVFRMDRTELNKRCKGCSQRFVCGGDSTHCWNFDKNEPYLCLYEILNNKTHKCVHCGFEMKKGYSYCPICGTKLQKRI